MQGVGANHADPASPWGETPLLAAAAHGRLSVVRRLLAHPEIEKDRAGRRGVTALMGAAAGGHDDVCLALLRAGVDRHAVTDQRRGAADYAAEHGHVALGALLAADPATSSIHDAAAGGRLLALDGLLRQRPDLLHARRPRDGATPLHAAASRGRLPIVNALLAREGVEVDAADAEGATPLMRAAAAGARDVCGKLLARGADSSRRDKRGRTATSWAATKSYGNMALFLGTLAVS